MFGALCLHITFDGNIFSVSGCFIAIAITLFANSVGDRKALSLKWSQGIHMRATTQNGTLLWMLGNCLESRNTIGNINQVSYNNNNNKLGRN